ncbi:ROK family protein [Actinosynnema sp. NPDC020468]|uniref:ROK family protein n=1 Tax=Actinosynnema sp. NPDC020468 TaxID=3154488 RepID=UPI0033CBDFD5
MINDRTALFLLCEGPLTAAQLAEATGLSRPSVADLVKRLQEAGLVAAVGLADERRRGPNAVLYGLVRNRAHLAALDVRTDGVTVVVSDLLGEVLARGSTPIVADETAVERTADLLASTARDAGADTLHAIALGVPGLVHPSTGALRVTPGMPRWHVGLVDALRARLSPTPTPTPTPSAGPTGPASPADAESGRPPGVFAGASGDVGPADAQPAPAPAAFSGSAGHTGPVDLSASVVGSAGHTGPVDLSASVVGSAGHTGPVDPSASVVDTTGHAESVRTPAALAGTTGGVGSAGTPRVRESAAAAHFADAPDSRGLAGPPRTRPPEAFRGVAGGVGSADAFFDAGSGVGSVDVLRVGASATPSAPPDAATSVGSAEVSRGRVAVTTAGPAGSAGALVHLPRLIVENETTLAALAEHRLGVARDRDTFVLLWLGTGTGAALVLGGVPYRGRSGGAGELGYLPLPGVPRPTARSLGGGFHGLASSDAVTVLAGDHRLAASPRPGEPMGAALVREAVAVGSVHFLDDLADRVTVAAAALVAVLDPGCLVLGGELGHAGGVELASRVEARLAAASPMPTEVRAGALGGTAVLRGALVAACESARDELFGPAVTG